MATYFWVAATHKHGSEARGLGIIQGNTGIFP